MDTSDEEDVTFEVESILSSRQSLDGKTLYLVAWKGYGKQHSTWEPAENLPADVIARFEGAKQLASNSGEPSTAPVNWRDEYFAWRRQFEKHSGFVNGHPDSDLAPLGISILQRIRHAVGADLSASHLCQQLKSSASATWSDLEDSDVELALNKMCQRAFLRKTELGYELTEKGELVLAMSSNAIFPSNATSAATRGDSKLLASSGPVPAATSDLANIRVISRFDRSEELMVTRVQQSESTVVLHLTLGAHAQLLRSQGLPFVSLHELNAWGQAGPKLLQFRTFDSTDSAPLESVRPRAIREVCLSLALSSLTRGSWYSIKLLPKGANQRLFLFADDGTISLARAPRRTPVGSAAQLPSAVTSASSSPSPAPDASALQQRPTESKAERVTFTIGSHPNSATAFSDEELWQRNGAISEVGLWAGGGVGALRVRYGEQWSPRRPPQSSLAMPYSLELMGGEFIEVAMRRSTDNGHTLTTFVAQTSSGRSLKCDGFIDSNTVQQTFPPAELRERGRFRLLYIAGATVRRYVTQLQFVFERVASAAASSTVAAPLINRD